MISDSFKKWHPVWESKDNSIRVEKTVPTHKNKKEQEVIIDISAEEDEEESETEDYVGLVFEEEDSQTLPSDDMTWDVTIPVVNNNVYGYNKKGGLEKLKIKKKTLKII